MDHETSLSLFTTISEWLQQINGILLVIGLCSIVAIAVFIERVKYLNEIDIDTESLLIDLRTAIQQGNIVEAISLCENHQGAVSNIIKAGIANYERPRERIEFAMEMKGMIEIAKMEKNTRVLSIIAHIAPLIGLLGTVLGFIRAFAEMKMSGMIEISASQIGDAMEYALVSTAAGLVVAIPTVLAYNYLVARIESLTVEIQATAAEVVDVLTYKNDMAER